MSHPEPKTTDEWLIDIYNKVERIEHVLASLPCSAHDERLARVEHWQSTVQVNTKLAGRILAAVTTAIAIFISTWKATGH